MKIDCNGLKAPWQEPELFPSTTLRDGRYGLWTGDQVEAITTERLLDALREEWLDPEKQQEVGLVEVPGREHLLSRFEVPIIQSQVLEQCESELSNLVKKHRFLALILVPFAVLGNYFGMNTWIVAIPAFNSIETLWDSFQEKKLLKRDPGAYLAYLATLARFGYWVENISWKKLWRSQGLAGIFVLIFVCQMGTGLAQSVTKAALIKSMVYDGEFWRIFSTILMHGSYVHIIINIYSWFFLATTLERIASRHLVMPVFLISGISGNLFSLALLPSDSSLGASGGILGMLGFLTVLGLRRKSMLPPGYVKMLLRSLFGLVVLGFAAWKIVDNAAHFGGYLVGSILGVCFFGKSVGPLPLPSHKLLWIADILALLVLAGVTCMTLFRLLN